MKICPNTFSHNGHVSILWENFKKRKLNLICLFIIIAIPLACVMIPPFYPFSHSTQNLALGITDPSPEHILGTDALGRDLLARILYGGRISFFVAITATAVSLLIGVQYGMISGFLGGITDKAMMRFVEIMYSLPYVIFVILVMVFLGKGLLSLLIAIGAIEWLAMARIIRSQVLSLKEAEFIQAAHALGQTKTKIIFKHLLPNLSSTILVCATLTIPSVILVESMLSFLGLGIHPPMTSWGDIIKEGVKHLEEHPHLLILPSSVFFVTLLSLNIVSDGIRNALDPKHNT